MDKNIPKYGITLMFVCLVAALLLSLVYKVTEPKIIAQKNREADLAKREVLPLAVEFNKVQGQEYIRGFDSSGNLAGIIVNIVFQGYAGPIEMLVGVGNDKKITGIKVLSHTETAGLGAKITDSAFISQFAGKSEEDLVLTKDNGTIEAITAATISSQSVTDAVKEVYKNMKW